MTDDPACQPVLRVFDSVKALAFIGDLSMGQPTDHSLRVAWLAAQLAQAAGFGEAERDAVREVSLLRWSGCTANAAGFGDVFGDDIASRAAMLEGRPDWADPLAAHGGASAALTPLAQIHCEVSGEVARILGLASGTEIALRHIFETWDGNGLPARLAGDAVPAPVLAVTLAGDLEIYSRVHGADGALARVAHHTGARYPERLAALGARHLRDWLAALERLAPAELDAALLTASMQQATAPELIADVIDLKLPWMTGFSREVADTAAACCARLTPDAAAPARVYRAALVHGIGRAAVPNGVWNTAGPLPPSTWEKVRLAPYWTARAGRQAGALGEAAELGSHAYERLDGSGYFRGVRDTALALEARVLAAAVAWVAMRSARPWRAALPAQEAVVQLRDEAARGRLDTAVVEALIADGAPTARRAAYDATSRAAVVPLSPRELEVLRAISRGASNKEAARELMLSPSTVRTHVESVFRKLACSTRAAATLKASSMGLL